MGWSRLEWPSKSSRLVPNPNTNPNLNPNPNFNPSPNPNPHLNPNSNPNSNLNPTELAKGLSFYTPGIKHTLNEATSACDFPYQQRHASLAWGVWAWNNDFQPFFVAYNLLLPCYSLLTEIKFSILISFLYWTFFQQYLHLYLKKMWNSSKILLTTICNFTK